MKLSTPTEEEFGRFGFRTSSWGAAMFGFVIFFSAHLAVSFVSSLELWAQDFGLIVVIIMALVMFEALMMLILAVTLSAGLWIYSCARAVGAALLPLARRLHRRAEWKLHELR
jgi:hypothetical protein